MKYAILIYETDKDFALRTADSPEGEAYYAGHGAYCQALAKAGVFGGGLPLTPSEMGAKTIRVRDGKTVVQDGPYADTKEQLGGFALVEADNLDRALEWAARCPCASTGAAEVRPRLQMPPTPAPPAKRGDATHVLLICANATGAGPKTPEEGEAIMHKYFAYIAAIGEVDGPAAGLAALAEIPEAEVETYQPYWATRAHLLARAGRTDEARAAYKQAIGLAEDAAARDFLRGRAAALGDGEPGGIGAASPELPRGARVPPAESAEGDR
jgi:hypothetical protein